MKDMLRYKGYFGSVEYSAEDEVLAGRLEFIRDLITYEGEDIKTLKAAFEEAVDDYLALCASQDREPEVPLKGSFNVRPGRELHQQAMVFAKRHGTNLNTVVSEALKKYLRDHSDAA